MRYLFPIPSTLIIVPLIGLSNHVCKAAFHAAKVPDAQDEKRSSDNDRESQSSHIERRIASEDHPAEAVNNSGHRIEGHDSAPSFRNVGRSERDRRNK